MRVICAGLVLALGLSAGGVARGADWELLSEDEGIRVWKKQIEGSDFVAFRGRGIIKAPILNVAAVIRDADRETEWMENCVDGKTLRFLSATDAIVYNRTGSPAPLISDRDTVLKSVTTVMPKDKTVLIEFSQVEDPKMPPKEGVVRMPVLKGHWKLRQVGAYATELEYQVLADPGGSLPAWLVNLVSRKMPFHTVERMRKQVSAGGYEQHRQILELAIDWTGFELPPTEATISAGQP